MLAPAAETIERSFTKEPNEEISNSETDRWILAGFGRNAGKLTASAPSESLWTLKPPQSLQNFPTSTSYFPDLYPDLRCYDFRRKHEFLRPKALCWCSCIDILNLGVIIEASVIMLHEAGFEFCSQADLEQTGWSGTRWI
jgi:hypothetical protein